MGKTKKITNVNGNKTGNPFGIKTNSSGFNIGQQMLKGKAGVRSTADKRKSVRVPVELYASAVDDLSHGERFSLMTEILTEFFKKFEKEGEKIILEFNDLETRPIKISEEAFRILKVFKFETDQSNTNIIASALTWYLKKNKGKS